MGVGSLLFGSSPLHPILPCIFGRGEARMRSEASDSESAAGIEARRRTAENTVERQREVRRRRKHFRATARISTSDSETQCLVERSEETTLESAKGRASDRRRRRQARSSLEVVVGRPRGSERQRARISTSASEDYNSSSGATISRRARQRVGETRKAPQAAE
jgi:hypothetical protein